MGHPVSEVFLDYSKYYDLLYKDKNYKQEAEFVLSLIKRFCPHARTLLNIGCGTGEHDQYFAEVGFKVTGVDLSEQMINIARAKDKADKCQFIRGDARSLRLNDKFDVVISLFHVLSYQTRNVDVTQFLNTVSKHLNAGGISIIDYWYGPAVLNLKPEKRVKKFSSDHMHITRHASTDMNYLANIATVNFDIQIDDLSSKKKTNLHEKHPMRYFFSPEIDLFAERCSLEHIHHAEWMETSKVPSETSWAAYSVFKK